MNGSSSSFSNTNYVHYMNSMNLYEPYEPYEPYYGYVHDYMTEWLPAFEDSKLLHGGLSPTTGPWSSILPAHDISSESRLVNIVKDVH